ncbi:hypothetical protein [Actinacidiphila alni]|uniref:Uncharacterized protein n=1 Tax=Actinacidiphila alni TaxID=380248 RepID=A0A1I2AWE9_9ACTN|nr:hypothetical protein [Actinacidiphila alni]SFE48271.1 hypothetical protein SAMN05216251_103256 [Actinacidiphila alni]
MSLHELFRDPESPDNNSPTLYYDDETDTFLFQSWKVVDASRLTAITVPEHETVIEFPKRILSLFPRTADEVHVRARRKAV